MKQVFETDWLASTPVFYNEISNKVSHNINDVIDFNKFDFDPEGLNNYLDFGYCILGRTPIRSVKFLSHSSRLTFDQFDKIQIEKIDDLAEKYLDVVSDEQDLLNLLYSLTNSWEKSIEGEIIIPTSGGYDSRLLNLLINDKSRIRSFTYGISEKQQESYEVVYAKKISEILGTQWEQIVLEEFHQYFDDWDRLFGVSTHAHGMYHIEFYKKILEKVSGNNPFLSGIIGDAWAGSVNIPEISSEADLYFLGYTHGVKADSQMSLFKSDLNSLKEYYERHQDKLKYSSFRVVEAMRFKMILLSYLQTLPKFYNFEFWSPFLLPNVAMSMLNLPSEKRKNRLWQQEIFKANDLDLESMKLILTYENTLDLQGLKKIPLKSLDVNLLREVVKIEYVEWINKTLAKNMNKFWFIDRLTRASKLRKLIPMLDFSKEKFKAYNAYVTLKPIENLIQKRNNFLCA